MIQLIDTRRLGKHYLAGTRRIQALNGISLSIREGEMTAIMGPSGSGKSTLLHLLGCLDRPSSGSYWFAGVPVNDLKEQALARLRRRHIGFVFQNFNLLPRLSAEDNVALPLLYAGLSRGEANARARDVLERVGLTDRRRQRAASLSGGEQQRVAIARGLVASPKLLLADEPTGALDSRNGRLVLQLLKDLNGTGITVLLVTHDRAVADIAEHLIRLKDGRLVSDYRPARRPIHRPTAVLQ
jgi:ABC-type lipoprotein export system ATPase subunit